MGFQDRAHYRQLLKDAEGDVGAARRSLERGEFNVAETKLATAQERLKQAQGYAYARARGFPA
jgi:hypothetical protein